MQPYEHSIVHFDRNHQNHSTEPPASHSQTSPSLFQINTTTQWPPAAPRRISHRRSGPVNHGSMRYPLHQEPSSTHAALPVEQPYTYGNHEKFRVTNMPPGWSTRDVYSLLQQYGTIVRIEILKPNHHQTCAYVTYSLPEEGAGAIPKLIRQPANHLHQGRAIHLVPMYPQRQLGSRVGTPATVFLKVRGLAFGIMSDQNLLKLPRSLQPQEGSSFYIALDRKYECIDIMFHVGFNGQAESLGARHNPMSFKLRLNLPQIMAVCSTPGLSGRQIYIIKTAAPPVVFRKIHNVLTTHESGADFWNEEQCFMRQTGIRFNPNDNVALTQLRDDDNFIEIGRWLTYSVELDSSVVSSNEFQELLSVLEEHSVLEKESDTINTQEVDRQSIKGAMDLLSAPAISRDTISSSVLDELHQMGAGSIHLPFEVYYQLEACMSHGVLNECNIDAAFLYRLAEMETLRATGYLEAALDPGETESRTFYNPADIFRLSPKIPIAREKIPPYCTMVRSATVTPTTIYFSAPVLETSNRVVRRYRQYEDRFLRVRFTDERYKGKILSGDDDRMNEVFTRIKRTLKNGIKVGDRVFEFLASGNSQFREGGAYFFASTSSCTAQNIRDWMGTFHEIKVVAKYCSRLGQSFSTTRAMQIGVNIERIPDIERNGYNFTDGVGRISPFLAQMIAQEHGLPNSTVDYPSVFQFRLAGCKGVLAVDPSVSRNTIQIRPSQEKFPAMHRGLEICRISQFSPANLNVQLILVLSTLGVPDTYFLQKMRFMLADLKAAMDDESKAVELLRKNVDFNRMTVKLAEIIQNGFMSAEDPFVISCLHLWRSWSIKYLKEKQRLFIEEGAFLLGCVDETGLLRGHFNDTEHETEQDRPLPEIFVQIPDAHIKGKWKVITGTCVVARNPSLHPGDVRVVVARDVPELHHMRNCVVFPQTGDRDIPNMLSGGDLDGDDFIVMWDKGILPEEWNHPPMDYTAPSPQSISGSVTVDQMTTFFVQHLKNDSLSRIAVAHRYWADYSDEGVKDHKCIELATLHSQAVDFSKTGIPAKMSRNLRVVQWPHWSEAKNRRLYTSKKIIGQLYDEAQRSRFPFVAAWHLPFDNRILNAREVSEEQLSSAQQVKRQYDTAVRRLMTKFGIASEFEVWTTFVLQHNNDIGDYKFAETIGEAVLALKDHHRTLCFEGAGTTQSERDLDKLEPFIVAMYTITARELQAALEECENDRFVDGKWIPPREMSPKSMPFISFPWLFPEDLGRIACGERCVSGDPTVTLPANNVQPKTKSKTPKAVLVDDSDVPSVPEVSTAQGVIKGGELLDLFHKDSEAASTSLAALHDLGVEPLLSTVNEAAVLQPAAITDASTNGSRVSYIEELTSCAEHTDHIQPPNEDENIRKGSSEGEVNGSNTAEERPDEKFEEHSVDTDPQDTECSGECIDPIAASTATALDQLDQLLGL